MPWQHTFRYCWKEGLTHLHHQEQKWKSVKTRFSIILDNIVSFPQKGLIDIFWIFPPIFFIAEIERACSALSDDVRNISRFYIILRLFSDEKTHRDCVLKSSPKRAVHIGKITRTAFLAVHTVNMRCPKKGAMRVMPILCTHFKFP